MTIIAFGGAAGSSSARREMKDFPAPTGAITTVSLPERMDCIAADWNSKGVRLCEAAESSSDSVLASMA